MTRPADAGAAAVPTELLASVITYFKPRRIILFGSQARGDAGSDSDIDLLVVMDDDSPSEKLTLRAGFESRSGYRGSTDIIPIRESVFRRKRNIVGTLAFAGAHEGVVVYERAPDRSPPREGLLLLSGEVFEPGAETDGKPRHLRRA